ncbi:MAG: glycosyltransferase [Deltaproteobacteria bacterium]
MSVPRTHTVTLPPDVGLVLIGRNEGQRLVRALERLGTQPARCVYVDSGSTDGSVANVASRDIAVVELDESAPFTAARARNTGFRYLSERWPETKYVMFLDGDCVLHLDWLETAAAAFRGNDRLGVATGVLREVNPDASVYNRLCDMEWNGPVGPIDACGGNAMIRAEAYGAAGGMRTDLIAGEEAELHLRLRQAGWKVVRLDAPMAHHDAELFHFSQWWKRSIRSGHACAEGAFLHGEGPEAHQTKEVRSNWFWGLAVPAASVGLLAPTLGLSSALVGVGYPVLYGKVLKNQLEQGKALADAELYARYTVLGKVPQALGQLTFWVNRARGKRAKLYEYKDTHA